MREALTAEPALWREDLRDSRQYLEELGARVPQEIFDELDLLSGRIKVATRVRREMEDQIAEAVSAAISDERSARSAAKGASAN